MVRLNHVQERRTLHQRVIAPEAFGPLHVHQAPHILQRVVGVEDSEEVAFMAQRVENRLYDLDVLEWVQLLEPYHAAVPLRILQAPELK